MSIEAEIGTEEGERCNRVDMAGMRCDGEMYLAESENCSCHISPPCGSCTDAPILCSVCGKEAGEF